MRTFRILLWRARLGLTRPKRLVERLRMGAAAFVRISPEDIAAFCPSPRLILEAGAADGSDTVLLSRQFPHSRILAVEPVPEALNACRAKVAGIDSIVVVEGALSDFPGVADLFVSSSRALDDADSSSLLEPSGHKEVFPSTTFTHRIQVRTFTIDGLTESLGLESPDVMWLDMQGMEMRVLAGSQAALSTAIVVVTEASRIRLYEGAPTFSELKRFMHVAGFRLGLDRMGAISGNVLFYRPDCK